MNIALACLLLAATHRDKINTLKSYMIEAQIDVERIYEVVKLILKYYELMTTYDADAPAGDGKQMKELLTKIPKPKVATNGSSRPSSQPNEQQIQMAMGQQNNNGQQQNNNTANL